MGNAPRYTENDTEQSFTYTEGNTRTDLSILTSAGDESACISKAQYQDGIDEPLKEETLHISSEEGELLSDLLNRSKFL